MTNRVVHFEIPADDMARAQRFYRDAFGWAIDAMPDFDYAILRTIPVDERRMPVEPGAINGGMLARGAPVTSPVIIINVADMDAALTMVERNGGSVVRGKLPVGEMGWAAYVRDTEGNVVGLWQGAGG